MGTSAGYIEFVCEQIAYAGDVRGKKMFGEYMVYVNEKPVLMVCDNTVFVKKLKEIGDIMKGSDVGFPYEGAKEHYILDIENVELSKSAIETLVEITPVPKPRKPGK